jgi:hypothetical protein
MKHLQDAFDFLINNLFFIDNLSKISVSFAMITAICLIFYGLLTRNMKKIGLEDIINQAFTASSIPTGLVLIQTAFVPTNLQKLDDVNIHIATAGIALLYISIKSLLVYIQTIKEQSQSSTSRQSGRSQQR